MRYVEQDSMVYADTTWGLDRIDQRDLPLDDSYMPVGKYNWSLAPQEEHIIKLI